MMVLVSFIIFLTINKVANAWTDISLTLTTNTAMFDISSDPYETTDVINDASYAFKLEFMETRRTYWQNYTIDSNTPDSSDKVDTWASCGQVCPWLNDTGTSFEISQIYDYADAPHIVFVLVDDWGYNDLGKRSTYLNFTTPTLDSLADNGILLESYYTNEMCGPSRASLMTGRYSLRLGIHSTTDELPKSEVTLADELKSAGYRSYIVGKWHLGMSKYELLPTNRGFDKFYGYLSGYESYYTKKIDGYVDLFEDTSGVTDTTALDDSYHSAYLFQSKVEEIIKDHAENYADTPMFLYYPMHLVHYPWTAPATYLERCVSLSMTDADDFYVTDDNVADSDSDLISIYNYCGMNLMMDEAISNLTCTLNQYGFTDNTILIISGDNGGEPTIEGGNYPFKGHKATAMRGAFANTAIVHSRLIPKSRRGGTYSDDVHITDWLPTLMHLATGGEWTGGYTGNTIDGENIWEKLIDDEPTTREEIVFVSSTDTQFVGQYNGLKYLYHVNVSTLVSPLHVFTEDLDSSLSSMECSDPSLLSSSESLLREGLFSVNSTNSLESFVLFSMISVFSVFIVFLMVAYHRQTNKVIVDMEAPEVTVDEMKTLL